MKQLIKNKIRNYSFGDPNSPLEALTTWIKVVLLSPRFIFHPVILFKYFNFLPKIKFAVCQHSF